MYSYMLDYIASTCQGWDINLNERPYQAQINLTVQIHSTHGIQSMTPMVTHNKIKAINKYKLEF
jgi:hypothetical protein